MITKYKYNQMKKEEKARKRAEKKKKRAEKKFKRQSKSRYTFLDRTVVKGLNILSWIFSFGYAGYSIYQGYKKCITETDTGFELIKVSILFVVSVILFSIFIRALMKHLKLREQANSIASNQGLPSLKYSPIVTIFIRAVLVIWLLSIFWLFAFISESYAIELTKGFQTVLYAVSMGFFFKLWASIYEQSTLKRIRTNKLNAEHRTQMMIQELHNKK